MPTCESLGTRLRRLEEGGGVPSEPGYGVCRALNQESKSLYFEAEAVPNGVKVNLFTITVPLTEDWYLQRISFSGENIAEYELAIDGVTADKYYTWFGTSLSGEMNFEGFPSYGRLLTAGRVIAFNVKHKRPYPGNFNARIQWMERIEPIPVGSGSTTYTDP